MRDGMTPAGSTVHAPPLAIRAWLRYDVVRRVIDRLEPHRILEIGCGQGAFGARIADRFDYLGCEPDISSFEVAASRIEARGGTVINGTNETTTRLDGRCYGRDVLHEPFQFQCGDGGEQCLPGSGDR